VAEIIVHKWSVGENGVNVGARRILSQYRERLAEKQGSSSSNGLMHPNFNEEVMQVSGQECHTYATD
jgi:hypothetical protein